MVNLVLLCDGLVSTVLEGSTTRCILLMEAAYDKANKESNRRYYTYRDQGNQWTAGFWKKYQEQR